jgi:hypothetical protein
VRCPAPFSPTKSVLDLPQAVCVLSLVLVCLVPVLISLHVNMSIALKQQACDARPAAVMGAGVAAHAAREGASA